MPFEPLRQVARTELIFVGIVILPVGREPSPRSSVASRMARNNMVDLAISIPLNGAMQISSSSRLCWFSSAHSAARH